MNFFGCISTCFTHDDLVVFLVPLQDRPGADPELAPALGNAWATERPQGVRMECGSKAAAFKSGGFAAALHTPYTNPGMSTSSIRGTFFTPRARSHSSALETMVALPVTSPRR